MKSDKWTKITLAILAILLGINIYLTLRGNVSLQIKVNNSIKESKDFLNGIKIPGVDEEKLNDYINSKVHEELEKQQPKDGKDATVDYGLIYSTIDNKIASLPLLQGERGIPGINGVNGKSCTVTQTDTGALITCEDGTSAIITNGTNGTNGVDGRSVELRCNSNKNRWEMRYTGETNYTVIRNSSDGTPVKCVII